MGSQESCFRNQEHRILTLFGITGLPSTWKRKQIPEAQIAFTLTEHYYDPHHPHPCPWT